MSKVEFVPVVEVPLIAVTEEGHIGYTYSSKPHAAGEVVRLGLVERDGKMRLGLVK